MNKIKVKYKLQNILYQREVDINEFVHTFAEFMCDFRKKLGLTYVNMGEITGYDQSYFKKFENGERLPSSEFLVIFSSAFHIPFSYFEGYIKQQSDRFNKYSYNTI